MKIKNITSLLETWAPLSYAEDFDNVGLLVGNKENECTGVLITHDVSVTVVEEAIKKECQLIICFHPILFNGLKRITGRDYVEKTIVKAIENQIAIFALHTALDNHQHGISYQLGQCLGLENQHILLPQKDSLFQLTTYVPPADKDKVMNALHAAGAGKMGRYSYCSFSVEGEGRFLGDTNSNPTIGQPEKLTKTPEEMIRLLVPKHAKQNILNALQKSHPYEAVAYELVALQNENPTVGMGSLGKLPNPLPVDEFLSHVKKQLNIPYVRHTQTNKNNIETVAVLGGSGSFCIDPALAKGADALVTADLKYHDFFKAENQLLLVDAGHYETEHFTKKIIHQFLTKKIPNFAITLSEVNTNPVKYF